MLVFYSVLSEVWAWENNINQTQRPGLKKKKKGWRFCFRWVPWGLLSLWKCCYLQYKFLLLSWHKGIPPPALSMGENLDQLCCQFIQWDPHHMQLSRLERWRAAKMAGKHGEAESLGLDHPTRRSDFCRIPSPCRRLLAPGCCSPLLGSTPLRH